MALGGGTFLVQNKVLPGAYINFVSRARALGSLGERGTVAMMLYLNWGKEDEFFTVESEEFQKECLNIFGYNYISDEMLFLREVFQGAKTVKCYRPKSGEKAKTVIDGLTVTAKHGGTRGNNVTIIISQNIDDDDIFEVTTCIGSDHTVADAQMAKDIESLTDNDFVSFSGTGALTETAGTVLTGGTDKSVAGVLNFI